MQDEAPVESTVRRSVSDSLRITLITHSYWPEQSPPQRRWTAMIKEFTHSGWNVDVVTPVAHYPFGRRALAPWLLGNS